MQHANPAEHELYRLADSWQSESRQDQRDYFPYFSVLDEVFFHAHLRFGEYIQYIDDEGEFPVRLRNWVSNVKDTRMQKALIQLLASVTFVDNRQMLSLCRDAYRRIITPWLVRHSLSVDDYLSSRFESIVLNELRSYPLYSITESFNFPNFYNANNLAGIPKPTILGERERTISSLLPRATDPIKGLIILEDFVGTANQASKVLARVIKHSPRRWRLLFVPLIIMKTGLSLLQEVKGVETRPVVVIHDRLCLGDEPKADEPQEYAGIRALVKATRRRVLVPFDEHDDPPGDPFGYGGSGALIVTSHNTPNNTLPLIHHRAPDWSPLFRRLHHSKDFLR